MLQYAMYLEMHECNLDIIIWIRSKEKDVTFNSGLIQGGIHSRSVLVFAIQYLHFITVQYR